ncbi:MAG TPA: response regulator [Kofleriaceae bacterium]|nr:response regulator [Kofleriaceae bacterium]
MRPDRPWVLVVDDDEEVRETIAVVLAQYGLRSVGAPSGLVALELLRDAPPPRVVLLDLRMPQMSGAELVRAMRRDPALAGTPIVIMSGDSGAGHLAEQLDAEACLRKPFELGSLVATVRRFVGHRPDLPMT